MVILLGIGLGWVIGVVFGVLENRHVPHLAQVRPGILGRMPPSANLTVMLRLALFVAFLYWGILGAVIGAVHNLTSVLVPVSGLGSPNLVFTLVALASTALAGGYVARRFPKTRSDVFVLAVLLAVLFGWLLPIVAA